MSPEQELWARGLTRVAGVDEAGRGPWAGPVMAACVVLPPDRFDEVREDLLHGLTDSKKLTPALRERFFERITQSPDIQWHVSCVSAVDIDRIRIHRATYHAMAKALDGLSPPAQFALVDGYPVPGLPCPSSALVRGDSLSLSISAASVLAKVTRDRIMQEADSTYPGYGFSRHKGYGTAAHREALGRLGVCPLHRRSFAPIRAFS